MARSTPAQDRVVRHVAANPGVVTGTCAREIGPHGSAKFGYRAIFRALYAGKITRTPHQTHRGWTVLHIVPEHTV